ncbi:hypothetical protein CDAR_557651 [Caerostris darwini]|uniref:Uncharacterized protein n=1 Tax=Caerostris darwini TaxID=1538125 RepID=A0AAV4VB72_9ARAC|nr:hypothetical protein CDAR_557651 [Caerostris darwini]
MKKRRLLKYEKNNTYAVVLQKRVFHLKVAWQFHTSLPSLQKLRKSLSSRKLGEPSLPFQINTSFSNFSNPLESNNQILSRCPENVSLFLCQRHTREWKSTFRSIRRGRPKNDATSDCFLDKPSADTPRKNIFDSLPSPHPIPSLEKGCREKGVVDFRTHSERGTDGGGNEKAEKSYEGVIKSLYASNEGVHFEWLQALLSRRWNVAGSEERYF